MPLNKLQYHGTESDGSHSTEYCTYCYQNGRFQDDGISLEEKIDKNIAIAIKMGMPEEVAFNNANSIIPQLKRWKNS